MDLSALNQAIAAATTAENSLNDASTADDKAEANLKAATDAAAQTTKDKASAIAAFNKAMDALSQAALASKIAG